MITKCFVHSLREDINAALAAVAQKHGLKIHAGSATYDENAATFKLVCSTFADNGRAMTPEASHYDMLAARHGWAPLFSTITLRGVDYVVVGYNPRARRQPVIIERNGERFKAVESVVSQWSKG